MLKVTRVLRSPHIPLRCPTIFVLLGQVGGVCCINGVNGGCSEVDIVTIFFGLRGLFLGIFLECLLGGGRGGADSEMQDVAIVNILTLMYN